MEKLLIIDATTKCNQKCLFCFEKDIHFTKPDLSLDKIKKIILKSKKDKFNYVNFIGGEITLVGWLPEAIRFIRSNEMGVGIVTNGTILSSRDYVEKLLKAGLNHIELSFHSHIPKDDYRITGFKNGLKLRKEALENIIDLRKDKKDFFLYVNIVVNGINYRYLNKIAKFLKNYNIDYLDIKVLRITDNIKDKNIIPRFGNIKKHLESVMAFLKNKKMPFKFENIPLCFIEPRYYVNSMNLVKVLENNKTGGYGFYYDNIDKEDMDFDVFDGKNDLCDKCTDCMMGKFCSRPQKEYLEIFGNKEFEPIRNLNKIKKQLSTNEYKKN